MSRRCPFPRPHVLEVDEIYWGATMGATQGNMRGLRIMFPSWEVYLYFTAIMGSRAMFHTPPIHILLRRIGCTNEGLISRIVTTITNPWEEFVQLSPLYSPCSSARRMLITGGSCDGTIHTARREVTGGSMGDEA